MKYNSDEKNIKSVEYMQDIPCRCAFSVLEFGHQRLVALLLACLEFSGAKEAYKAYRLVVEGLKSVGVLKLSQWQVKFSMSTRISELSQLVKIQT